MSINKEESSSNDSENKILREEVELQIHWYLIAFFIIFVGSFFVPGIIIILYIRFFLIPYVLEVKSFIALFTELNSLLVLIITPFIFIFSYLLHLFFIALITRWFWGITEKKSPSKDGIIPRGIPSKTLNYYHIRSFMIKYPKNAFVKGPFPYLINWLFNFVGTNKIGKGTTIEEQFGADRFVEIGENCYIGVNSGFSSHSVARIFGNLSYFKIKLGDNVTCAGLNCIAPGVKIGDNSYLFPVAGATKHNILKGNNYYFGAPLRKIFKRKIMEYLNLTEEDLEKNKKLGEKQLQIIQEIKKI